MAAEGGAVTAAPVTRAVRFVAEIARALDGLDLEPVDRAVAVLLNAYRRGRTVIAIGNGGSASTAAHFAADLGKFATGSRTGFRALDCVSNLASVTAWTNDEGWEETWASILRPWLEPGDVLVAFSVHGGAVWSGNLVRAILLARERGARTIGIAGAGGGRFRDLCDVPIVIPTPSQDLVTPITESLHVVVHHLVCAALRAEIGRT
jgi:D-sedoheptulose 7-phosphate isomerase